MASGVNGFFFIEQLSFTKTFGGFCVSYSTDSVSQLAFSPLEGLFTEDNFGNKLRLLML